MTGILVHGDNHFIVEGREPSLDEARTLVRLWSVIQIGIAPETPGWKIVNKALREELEWAVAVDHEDRRRSTAVVELLRELTARGIEIRQ